MSLFQKAARARADYAVEYAAAKRAIAAAHDRIDPHHEWASDEFARRVDLCRTVRARMDRIHRSQARHAATIAQARQELAGRTLARWVADWLSPAAPTR